MVVGMFKLLMEPLKPKKLSIVEVKYFWLLETWDFFAMHVLLNFYISKYSPRITELGFCEDELQGKGKTSEERLQWSIHNPDKNLTVPVESRTKLNFYFYTSLWFLKRF